MSFAVSTGEVMGGFVGPNHEDMAGMLERIDLSAGFGGKRCGRAPKVMV